MKPPTDILDADIILRGQDGKKYKFKMTVHTFSNSIFRDLDDTEMLANSDVELTGRIESEIKVEE